MTWDEMSYWQSKDWQTVQEKLDELERKSIVINPSRENLFLALDTCSLEKVRVLILGQDPYPKHKYATGIALSIPGKFKQHEFPPSLKILLAEYWSDLHYPTPESGDLSKWVDQGVLLWNVIPSCTDGTSLSHDWTEYRPLSREIISTVSKQGVVVVTLGGRAREFLSDVDAASRVLSYAHPSPRANRFSKRPFAGSRMFSTVNDYLNEIGKKTIEWRL